jgi:hypothetical protein
MDQAEMLPKRHVLTPCLIMTLTAFNMPPEARQQQFPHFFTFARSRRTHVRVVTRILNGQSECGFFWMNGVQV